MEYKNNRLSLDGVFFEDICSKHSTPTYVYSRDEILSNINSYKINIDCGDLVCFSVKSSNNLHILKLISSQGLGFDVVSGGDRDPESDGVDGISATQLREAAIDGDLDSFRLGIPDDLSLEDSKNLFLDLVDGLVD